MYDLDKVDGWYWSVFGTLQVGIWVSYSRATTLKWQGVVGRKVPCSMYVWRVQGFHCNLLDWFYLDFLLLATPYARRNLNSKRLWAYPYVSTAKKPARRHSSKEGLHPVHLAWALHWGELAGLALDKGGLSGSSSPTQGLGPSLWSGHLSTARG